MRHFNYFENGGPFPGTCISCGDNKQLFDVGGNRIDGGSNLLCHKCVIELATFIGFADKKPYEAEIERLSIEIDAQEKELNKVPNLVDGLINGIRSSVTDFIFAVSYSDDSDKQEPVIDIAPTSAGDDKGSEVSTGQRKAPSKPAIK